MTSQRFLPEDLIALARRSKLSAEQAIAFERLMRSSASAQELHRVGCAFDRVDPVQPGDESLVARSVESALLRRYQRPKLPKRLFGSRHLGAWLVAAVVLGSAASALGLAQLYIVKHKPQVSSSPSPVTATSHGARAVKDHGHETRPEIEPTSGPSQLRAAAAASLQPEVALPARPTPAAPAVAPAALRPTPSPSAVALAPTAAASSGALCGERNAAAEVRTDVPTATFDEEAAPPTAAELFQLANQARRQGNLALCVRQYRALQSNFPASAEALLSHVSLGKVLQSTGDVTAAVVEFSLYLKRPGALEEEALVGRAEGLARLGRASEEVAAWQRLLVRYPSSVYAGRARERLAALGTVNTN
jgi:TolA-binding protein